ncbi:MAG: ATP-binding protein [Planctomycetota bacterium]
MKFTMTLRAMNTLIWILLIVGGGLLVLGGVVFDQDRFAFSSGFAAILAMIAWYFYSAWLFGLARHVRGFLGKNPSDLTTISKSVSDTRLADMAHVLEQHWSNNNSNRASHTQGSFSHPDQAGSIKNNSEWSVSCQRFGIIPYAQLRSLSTSDITLDALVWRTIDVEGGKLLNVPENAVYFLMVQNECFVVQLIFDQEESQFHDPEANFGSSSNKLQVIAPSTDSAERLVHWLQDQAGQHSLLRKNALQISFRKESTNVRIVSRPTVDESRIILPHSIISLVERLIRQHEVLRLDSNPSGFSKRLGLLFYGPPGTGKTLMIRRIVEMLPNHTLITPSDLHPETLRSVFRSASYLQPAMIAIEDIDLLAVRRDQANIQLDGLQELMNEMDGLVSEHELMVVLTTNRPEIVEPALASRPGRISQAIEFTLPTSDLREDLLRLFLGESQGSQIDLQNWVKRTEGASPAFLEELSKRATMSAMETADGDEHTIRESDFQQAMLDLITTGGSLNAGILGFPNPDT